MMAEQKAYTNTRVHTNTETFSDKKEAGVWQNKISLHFLLGSIYDKY